MRYYQQVQALDVEGAWEKVAVPTLIVWGEYDWIMGRDESDRAPAIVKAATRASDLRHPPGWTTTSTSIPIRARRSPKKAGPTIAGAASVIVDWLRKR
jgi:hypothetical protein